MASKRKPRLCLVSSSGGHWEQLQKLKPLIEQFDGYWVTEKTAFEADARYLLLQTDLKDKWMLAKMLWNALYTAVIWARERPDYVITTGTMVAYPFYILAVLFRKKFVFIETFGRATQPTVAGRWMHKRAALFLVQWESQLQFYPNAIYKGCLY